MASVMAIESESFGSCVEEIDVSVEEGNSEERLCCVWKYLRLTEVEKAAQVWRW